MASTRQRGRNTELKVKKWLEDKGYQVQLAPMPTRYSRQNDLFGLWDALAVNGEEMLAVQVKMNRNDTYGKCLAKHRAWVCPPSIKKLCILWEANKRLPEIILL
jgi:Holliday junction resolvase-like predicted endonuclease